MGFSLPCVCLCVCVSVCKCFYCPTVLIRIENPGKVFLLDSNQCLRCETCLHMYSIERMMCIVCCLSYVHSSCVPFPHGDHWFQMLCVVSCVSSYMASWGAEPAAGSSMDCCLHLSGVCTSVSHRGPCPDARLKESHRDKSVRQYNVISLCMTLA